jgi:hypothetical protein
LSRNKPEGLIPEKRINEKSRIVVTVLVAVAVVEEEEEEEEEEEDDGRRKGKFRYLQNFPTDAFETVRSTASSRSEGKETSSCEGEFGQEQFVNTG